MFIHFVRKYISAVCQYCVTFERSDVSLFSGPAIQALRHMEGCCYDGLGDWQGQVGERYVPMWGVWMPLLSMFRCVGWVRIHLSKWEEVILQVENNMKVIWLLAHQSERF